MSRLLVLVALLLAAGCGGQENAREQPAQRASPSSASTSADPPQTAPADLAARARAAESVVRDFYASIDEQSFEPAWSRLSPALRRRFGGLATWRAGYGTTRRTEVTHADGRAADENHATVTVKLRSVDRDVCGTTVRQRFAGTWRLARAGGRWRAITIELTKTSGGTVRTAGADCSQASGSGDADRAPPQKNDANSGAESSGGNGEVCYPETQLPAVRLESVRLPAVRLPAVTVGDRKIPARTIPARTIPGRTIPARTIPGRCFDVPKAFELSRTTVRVSNYDSLDSGYSPDLSEDLWDSAPSVSTPDYTAQGFGELNGAGFPKNQYVRPYVRRDGTRVSGYWRNSPSDGLPTCRVIDC